MNELKETVTATLNGLSAETMARFQKMVSKQAADRESGEFFLLNKDCFYNKATDLVFVVEGELEAAAIMEVYNTQEAVALGSLANWEALVNMLEARTPLCNEVIIALRDTDDKNALKGHLERLGLTCVDAGFAGCDIYDLITAGDKETAKELIDKAVEKLVDRSDFLINKAKEELRKDSIANQLKDFKDYVETAKHTPAIPTGYKGLDNLLAGGLFSGLYIIGAISSLGKTTFCLQMAEQIAAAGRDVVIFSLEMGRNELIAKSLSREMYKVVERKEEDSSVALTTRNILAGRRFVDGKFESYTAKEQAYYDEALENYAEIAQNIYVHEGDSETGIDTVKEIIQRHVALGKTAPVIFIDYLQIMKPIDPRCTDKQNTDKAVSELKRISRKYNTPVFCISSFNRENYTAPVNLASFKESGAIEYSSDVLLALQYYGMDYRKGEKEADRLARVRTLKETQEAFGKKGEAQTIQLKVLKNRNGTKGSCTFNFYPKFNYFTYHNGFEPAGQTPYEKKKIQTL